MYFSERSHDLVNKVDYSRWVVYNHKMQVCTTVSLTDISSVQNNRDLVDGIKHALLSPVSHVTRPVIDAL